MEAKIHIEPSFLRLLTMHRVCVVCCAHGTYTQYRTLADFASTQIAWHTGQLTFIRATFIRSRIYSCHFLVLMPLMKNVWWKRLKPDYFDTVYIRGYKWWTRHLYELYRFLRYTHREMDAKIFFCSIVTANTFKCFFLLQNLALSRLQDILHHFHEISRCRYVQEFFTLFDLKQKSHEISLRKINFIRFLYSENVCCVFFSSS